MKLWFVALALAVFGAVALAGGQQPSTPTPAVPVVPQTKRLFAVGDIMECSNPERAERVGNLLKQQLAENPDTISLTLGDNSQDSGTAEDYDCLDRSVWSEMRPWLYPVAGNHDYLDSITTGAVPFMYLWFVNTGPVEDGYYSFNYGPDWHVVAINSELMRRVNGEITKRGRDMLTWLDADMHRYASTKCIVAYMHRPPFSSGSFAGGSYTEPIFPILYHYGVDLLLTGHEHFFAVFPPMNKRGVNDPQGVPQIIAGTGGARSFEPPRVNRYHESILDHTLGVLQLDLGPGTYNWKFLPVNADDPSPEGSGTCHDNPSND
jgi:hypothetical protein